VRNRNFLSFLWLPVTSGGLRNLVFSDLYSEISLPRDTLSIQSKGITLVLSSVLIIIPWIVQTQSNTES
jgi:hypothetical protein